ncbi:MAG: TPM domain-containing protein [Elusimicrobiota bacterium]
MKRYLFIFTLFFIPFSFLFSLTRIEQLKSESYVTDEARIISPQHKIKLEKLLFFLEQKTSDQVAVVTIPTLEGRDIETESVKLFKRWGIGQKGKNNGVLFLIVPGERKMRIEVGYGLEAVINDGKAGQILDQIVLPQFRTGNLSEGVVQGAVTIAQLLAQSSGVQLEGLSSRDLQKVRPLTFIEKIFFFIIFIIALIVFIRHPWLLFFLISRGGGSGNGGFGGGGFGGFGGGSSGGGGSSRGW